MSGNILALTLIVWIVSQSSIGVFSLDISYDVEWYLQRVDHFSYANNDIFKQRYLISTKHWQQNGPIFFYAGNEGDIMAFANNTGFMWEYAPQFKAMVVFMEHRYYGESMPYGKNSFKSLDDMGYLTTEQALTDYATFLTYLKNQIQGASQSPVVVFGGSYGGMLAAWFRMKYPHIAIGALAASAPILQFPGIYDCEGYFDIVSKDFHDYSPACSETIRKSWDAFKTVANSTEGLKFLTEQFVLCKELIAKDFDVFMQWISSAYESMAMTDYPNPANFLQPLPAYPIKHACGLLTDPNADDKNILKQVFEAVSVYYNYSGENSCNDILTPMSDTMGLEGWGFQACTEMVLPVCSNGKSDMFPNNPWNLKEYSESCRKQYGVSSDKYKALIEYGGEQIKAASNIIFSNGLRDPWSAGGVLKKISEQLDTIIIPGACHHEDLRQSGPNDPKPLIEARAKEVKIIQGWIDAYYSELKRNNM